MMPGVTTFSQVQFNPLRLLMCSTANCGLTASLPRSWRPIDGVSGFVTCSECGGRMMLVDCITVAAEVTIEQLDGSQSPPLYTYATPALAILSELAKG
jgi:uncharacterized Zn-finger protein